MINFNLSKSSADYPLLSSVSVPADEVPFIAACTEEELIDNELENQKLGLPVDDMPFLLKAIREIKEQIVDDVPQLDSLELKWYRYGYPLESIRNHREAAQFLLDTKLLFDVRGYQTSDPDTHAIQFDVDGHPKILVENAYKRVDEIQNKMGIHYDREDRKIKDQDGKEWNYYQEGLVKSDWKFDKDRPSYRISKNELQQLAKIAIRPQEDSSSEIESESLLGSADNDLEDENICFLQVFSSERTYFPDWKIFRNLNRETPTHTGCRIIKSDGSVYSTTIESEHTRSEVFSCPPFRLLSTVNAAFSGRDYDEMRGYSKRLVTTVAITPKKADQLLNDFHTLSRDLSMRFNLGVMNCTRIDEYCLKQAGCKIKAVTSLSDVLWSAFPSLEDIPWIGGVLNRIKEIVSYCLNGVSSCIPGVIKRLTAFVIDVIFFIPNRLIDLCRNLFFILCGIYRNVHPLSNDELERENEFPEHLQLFAPFERDISLCEIFNEEPGYFYWPGKIVDWQREQPSTQTFIYKKNRPQWCIVQADQEESMSESSEQI